MEKPRLTIEALQAKIKSNIRPDSDGCWIWQKSFGSHGYGNIGTGGNRVEAAHRVALEVFKGQIPNGLLALHECGNRKCCNPEHLYAGTREQNVADSKRHGTFSPPPVHKKGGKRWQQSADVLLDVTVQD